MESTTQSQAATRNPNALFALLRDTRRRHLASVLADRESSVSLSELAAAVAAREFERASDEVPAERTEAVAATLHHNHLPKLADADLVAYETETKTVVPTRIETLSAHLTDPDAE